jgi:murein tripeptide amidase MpaA
MTKIGDDTDALGETILQLHHKMLKIAQYRRRPYERWKKETEVMLEKDPGDPKIDRLRIICLYEADYNLYLKIMWAHRMVKRQKITTFSTIHNRAADRAGHPTT